MGKLQFRLKELMAEKERKEGVSVTYEAITEKTIISPNTLSRMAQGNAKMVGISVIERLLDYFGCDVEDLIVYENGAAVKDENGLLDEATDAWVEWCKSWGVESPPQPNRAMSKIGRKYVHLHNVNGPLGKYDIQERAIVEPEPVTIYEETSTEETKEALLRRWKKKQEIADDEPGDGEGE